MLCLNFLSLILPTSTEIHIAFREYQISCYNEIIQESREITQIGNFYCQRYKKEYPNYEQAKGLLPAWTIYEMFESYTTAKITNMRGREKKNVGWKGRVSWRKNVVSPVWVRRDILLFYDSKFCQHSTHFLSDKLNQIFPYQQHC